jgi:hypothetical protein
MHDIALVEPLTALSIGRSWERGDPSDPRRMQLYRAASTSSSSDSVSSAGSTSTSLMASRSALIPK